MWYRYLLSWQKVPPNRAGQVHSKFVRPSPTLRSALQVPTPAQRLLASGLASQLQAFVPGGATCYQEGGVDIEWKKMDCCDFDANILCDCVPLVFDTSLPCKPTWTKKTAKACRQYHANRHRLSREYSAAPQLDLATGKPLVRAGDT